MAFRIDCVNCKFTTTTDQPIVKMRYDIDGCPNGCNRGSLRTFIA